MTFGACAAPSPASAAETLEGLRIDSAATIAYREEVHHPALAEPERARGLMWVTPDGGLIKEQAAPRREISEIGKDFVSVRELSEDAANLLPIPPEARRMLDALRAVMSGRVGSVAAEYAPELTEVRPLWRLRLAVHDDPEYLPVFLIGCGAELRGMEIREPGAVRRLILFDRLP